VLEHRELSYAEALARAGSFTRAAEELGIAQSTLSRAILSLEERVGGRLFDRTSREVVPTALGRILVERARPILTANRELHEELAATLGLGTGHLRVLVGPYVASILLGAALGRFLAMAPGVRVDVDEADTDRLAGILEAGTVDLMVAEVSLLPDPSGFIIEPLRVRMGEYVCRAGHPLLDRETVTLPEIFEFPMATTQINPGAWERLVRGSGLAERADGLVESGSAVRCQSLTALADLVAVSDAVGIFTRGMIRRRLEEGSLAVVPLDGPRPTSDWGIVRRRDRTPSPAARAFMEAVRKADAEVPLD
jgi:DNA-binding transcriptional LysR family regulator